MKTYLVRYDVLNNIYNNINFLPNLTFFELFCFTRDRIGNLHIKFFIRLLSLNIDEIYFGIKYKEKENILSYVEFKNKIVSDVEKYSLSSEIYSKTELKEFYPSINFNNYKALYIIKNDNY